MMLASTFFTDRNFKKMPHKNWVVLGIATAAFGNFCMSHVQLATMTGLVICFMSFRYIGMGFVNMPLSDYGMSKVAREMTGHASSMFSWTRQLVNIVSMNVLTVIMDLNTNRYYRELTGSNVIDSSSEAYRQASMYGFQNDFKIITVILILALCFAMVAMKKEKREGVQ